MMAAAVITAIIILRLFLGFFDRFNTASIIPNKKLRTAAIGTSHQLKFSMT
jgi:hypothetical protein